MSKYKVNNHSVLNVSNEEAKHGASWHDIAKRRAFAQHGDAEELPDGDIHKPQSIDHSPHLPNRTAEETEEALTSIEDQIKRLHAQEAEKHRTQQPPQPPVQPQNQFDNDPYDDWFKE